MSHAPERLELEQWIERQVRVGFETERDIADLAEDLFPEAERATIEGALSEAVGRRSARLAEASRTDCDRLDDAFAALDLAGVLTRQNFTCCNNCGYTEIWDPIAETEARGQQLRGFLFYHRQDAEGVASADGPGLLHLSFGAVDSDEDDDVAAVGRAIAQALQAEGLTTTWDGSAGRRIGVTLDWRRRPKARAPLAVVPAPTAAEVLARWCAHLPVVSAANLAASAPPSWVELLLSQGFVEVAVAWARASHELGALLAVAAARPEHFALALRQVPRKDAFQLLELILGGGLEDPPTRRAIEARAGRLDRGLPREMAQAWLAVVQGGFQAITEPEGRAFVLDRWRQAEALRHDDHESDAARAALSAAVWVLLGDEAAKDHALGWLAESGSSLTPPSVVSAVLAAARAQRASERLLPAASLLPGLRSRVVADLFSSGRAEEAVATIESSYGFEQGRLWAQLARSSGAAEWLARAKGCEEPRALFLEGLITQAELDATNLELLWAEARCGDGQRATAGIRAWVNERADGLLEHGSAVRAWLAQGARPTLTPVPLVTAPEPAELEEAIHSWEATGSTWLEKRRARRPVHTILDAATALATTDQALRGRALLASVLERWDPVYDGLGDAVIAALLAHQQLSQAQATERRLGEAGLRYPVATAALAMALAPTQAGDARALVSAVLPHARTRAEAALLAPAVLAVQGPAERAAAIEQMRAAWVRADAEIDQLRLS